jgi:hypothetical protein
MLKNLSVLTLAAATLLTAQAPAPQTLSQSERDFAMDHLRSTRKLFLDSITGLTPEQWSFKAAPDRWSIAECAEHITIAEDFIFGLVQNQVMKTPADPAKRAEVKDKDEAIVKMVPNRSQKFQAPEPIVPKNRWPDPEVLTAHFKDARDAHIAYIESTQDDLRDHFLKHPAMGTLDAYQWILLMSAHTERHTEQINEVKADPKYPK